MGGGEGTKIASGIRCFCADVLGSLSLSLSTLSFVNNKCEGIGGGEYFFGGRVRVSSWIHSLSLEKWWRGRLRFPLESTVCAQTHWVSLSLSLSTHASRVVADTPVTTAPPELTSGR